MNDGDSNMIWKVIGGFITAGIGLLSTLTTMGVGALIAFSFTVQGNLAAISKTAENTEKQIEKVSTKVDSLESRMTSIEQKDLESDKRIEAFWDREWPQLKREIESNRRAIESLEQELRAREQRR